MQGRILGLKITDTTTTDTYCISVVYLPTNQNLDKEIMLDIVHKLRNTDDDGNDNYMILGDFNFIDHPTDKKHGLSQKDKQICKIWVPFLEELDMVDPFREQNPNKKVWSFRGTGVAGNSRIDRIYVKAATLKNFTNLKYIHTPFHGHKVFSFTIKNQGEWGKSYYKLNTSLFEDEEYDKIVDSTILEVNGIGNVSNRDKWEIFLMTMKTKSISYSTKRNAVKKKVKMIF